MTAAPLPDDTIQSELAQDEIVQAELVDSYAAEATPNRADEPAQMVEATAVDAELIETAKPTGGPWSFGMKALLVTTGVAGLQFALMRYLGPLPGLFIGMLVCGLAMLVLIVAAMIYGRRAGEDLMARLDQLAIRLTFAIVLLFAGTIVAGGGQLIYMAVVDARLAWNIRQDLGFGYQTTSVLQNDGVIEVIEITSVNAGGPMDQAGAEIGDIIVSEMTPKQLLQMIEENRGKQVDLTLASDASGPIAVAVEDRPQRVVTINVPP